MVQIGSNSEHVNFLVEDNLATSVILGCDICDRYFEAIKPRLTILEMDDASPVPIVRQPLKPITTVPRPEEQ